MDQAARRLYFVDAGRSILMMLIVVVHAGAPYAFGHHWIVDGGTYSRWITVLISFLGLFDVEAFFVIAGVLTMVTLRRYGAGGMLRRRMVRLAIPLAATALLLNIPLDLYLRQAGFSEQPLLSRSWITGGWLEHLWFLFDLVLYTLIVAALLPPLVPLVPRLEAALRRVRRRLGKGAIMLCVLGAMAFCQLVLVAAAHAMPQLYGDWIGASSPYSFLHYFLFFWLGLMLAGVPTLWRCFRTGSALTYALTIATLIASMLIRGDGIGATLIANLAGAFVTFSLVQFVFAQFYGRLNSPAPVWRHLSAASYSVYLVHHPIVVLSALWLTGVAWPAEVEFALLLAAGFGLSWLIHVLLISRVPLLSFLFNGKMPATTRQPSAAPRAEVLR